MTLTHPHVIPFPGRPGAAAETPAPVMILAVDPHQAQQLAFDVQATGAPCRIVHTIDAARAAEPWPVRVTLHPMASTHALWRAYMGRHQQNLVHQYHNGGLWPFVGGFWVMALVRLGLREEAAAALERLAQANAHGDWRFTEWFHGKTLAPMGMPGQSWNAATFLLAQRALEGVPTSW